MCVVYFIFFFHRVTLPCAAHFLICAPTNGGLSKSNCWYLKIFHVLAGTDLTKSDVIGNVFFFLFVSSEKL